MISRDKILLGCIPSNVFFLGSPVQCLSPITTKKDWYTANIPIYAYSVQKVKRGINTAKLTAICAVVCLCTRDNFIEDEVFIIHVHDNGQCAKAVIKGAIRYNVASTMAYCSNKSFQVQQQYCFCPAPIQVWMALAKICLEGCRGRKICWGW